VKLSVAVMAHPERSDNAEALSAALGGVPISYDPVPTPSKDPRQRWVTGRNAWKMHDPDADWHMVIQDDGVPCADLIEGLEEGLERLGDRGLFSAYSGIPKPGQSHVSQALGHARLKDHTWWSTKSLCWGVAICAPVRTIPRMLSWCDHPARAQVNYDKRVGVFYRDVLGWRTWHTTPSLVDHRDGPSLVGHGGVDSFRHTLVPPPASALELDWDAIPPRGLEAKH